MEMALGLNSIYTKRHLQNLHPNIKVFNFNFLYNFLGNATS